MDDELKGISLIVLGIVALLALVGLVLLFAKAAKTGQASFPIEPNEYYGKRAAVNYDLPNAPYAVAARRTGQEAQPRSFNDRLNEQDLYSDANERLLIGSDSRYYKYVGEREE